MLRMKRTHLLLVLVLPLQACAVGPQLLYGTAGAAERTKQLVLDAWAEGFRAFDTAAHPKNYNERGVGEALALLRQQGAFADVKPWVQTKFTPDACQGQPKDLHPYDPSSTIASQVRQSFSSSLDRLGVSRVDAYILHAPYESAVDTLEAWKAMEAIHHQGRALQLGVSNFDLEQLHQLIEIATVPVHIVQNRCTQDTGYDKAVREYCAQSSIQYQGFGVLTGNTALLASPAIEQFSITHGVTRQQVVFRMAMHLGVSPLTGTSNRNRMKAALSAAQLQLDDAKFEALNARESSEFTSSEPVRLLFVNQLSETVQLFWQHPSTAELHPNARIAPDTNVPIDSFHSHLFVARQGALVVGRWQVDRGQGDEQTVKIDKSLTVMFSNTGSAPLALFWKDPLEGAELDRGVIMPNADRPIDSFVGHHFVIRLSLPTAAGGRIVKEWIAAAERPGMQTVPLDSVANSSSAFYSSPDLPEAELEELIQKEEALLAELDEEEL